MDRPQVLIPTVFVILLVVGVVGYIFVYPGHGIGSGIPPKSVHGEIPDLVDVAFPLPNLAVSSPLTIAGRAKGSWYFEASAPVSLEDANGNVIAQDHVTALGDWMVEGYVPFSASLTFPPQPSGSSGTLVFKNDNPSGDPEREKVLRIPITFK